MDSGHPPSTTPIKSIQAPLALARGDFFGREFSPVSSRRAQAPTLRTVDGLLHSAKGEIRNDGGFFWRRSLAPTERTGHGTVRQAHCSDCSTGLTVPERSRRERSRRAPCPCR